MFLPGSTSVYHVAAQLGGDGDDETVAVTLNLQSTKNIFMYT